MATYIRHLAKQILSNGHWAVARECCNKGIPVETVILALMLARRSK